MNDYVVLVDSTSDLPPDVIKKLNIEVLPMTFTMDGKTYFDGEMTPKEFYEKTRNKVLASTSQINPGEFENKFEKFLKLGKDILCVCLSSSFSGTYNSACIAKKGLEGKYPERKIKVVDSLSASLGEGFLAYSIAKMKNQGISIEEAEQWANEIKTKICHWFVVDDLHHLRRGGRISQTVAIMGSMMDIKPVLNVNEKGKLSVVQKVRGRAKAIDYIVSNLEKYGQDIENQTIFISHADCQEDANKLAFKIREKFNFKELIISHVGPIIGAHVGHGTLALFFVGNQR